MKHNAGKVQHAWIWFWYNDFTRMFIVLIPSYFIFVIPFLIWLQLEEETFKTTLCTIYMIVLAWAFSDNDYTNLNKIGLTTDRRKMLNTMKKPE